MQLPDRWNPRLWLREWLLKKSAAEKARPPFDLSAAMNEACVLATEKFKLHSDGYRINGPVNADAQAPFVVAAAGVTVRTGVDDAGRIFAAGMGSVPPPPEDGEGGTDAS